MIFLITALAVYGLSSLLTSYDGLWGMFKTLRDKYPNSALQCTVCTSVWVAVPTMLLAYFCLPVVLPFAIVGVVIVLERVS